MIAVADGSGKIMTLTGNYIPIKGIDITPDIDAEQAVLLASEYIHETGAYPKNIVSLDNLGLTIYSLNTELSLCWMIQATYSGEGGYVSTCVFVNAHNGEIEATD